MRFDSKILLIVGLVLILGFVNSQIVRHEKELSSGSKLVLKLRPRDPRSLMQGDYMRLNYDLASKIHTDDREGVVYLKPGPHDLAQDPVPAGTPGAVKLRYRVHDGRVLFDIESFFFQEGQGAKYERAKYVELRVTPEGAPKILNLLDVDFKVL